MLMSLYYFAIEYQNRCEFYNHLTQIESQLSYKKLLDRIPNGIVLLDRLNVPLFYNHVVAKMVARRSGSSSVQSVNLEEKRVNTEEDKEVPIAGIKNEE